MTRTRLELDDDGRIVLVTDPGDGEDLEARAVRSDHDCPPELWDRWHELDEGRRDAQAFGAACKEEVEGAYLTTRGRFR